MVIFHSYVSHNQRVTILFHHSSTPFFFHLQPERKIGTSAGDPLAHLPAVNSRVHSLQKKGARKDRIEI